MWLMVFVPVSAFQEVELPDLGAIALEDTLAQAGAVSPFQCRTQGALIEHVGEGFMMKLRGKCNESEMFAAPGAIVRGLVLPDGDLSVEVKPVGNQQKYRVTITKCAERTRHAGF
jgi:hypothetical protein